MQTSFINTLSDYQVVGKLHETLEKEQRICKLQVKKNGNYPYFEISSGDISTTTGWITQVVTRNCNQLLGWAAANRNDVIEHLHRMNCELEKYFYSLSEEIKTIRARKLKVIPMMDQDLIKIKSHLIQASKGIDVLKNAYFNDHTALIEFNNINQKIKDLCQKNIPNLYEDMNQRLQELARRKTIRLRAEKKDLLEKEKDLYDEVDRMGLNKCST